VVVVFMHQILLVLLLVVVVLDLVKIQHLVLMAQREQVVEAVDLLEKELL